MARLRCLLAVSTLAISLIPSGVRAQERLGLQSVLDGTVTRSQLPGVSPPDFDARFTGQATLLATLQLTSRLFAFYEGRVSHIEGLNDHDPQLRQTQTIGVLQGYIRYSTRLPSGLNVQAGKFGHPFGQFLTRNYADQNPLLGYPLMYTYRTTIRSNQVPTGPYDFIRWQSRYQTSQGGYNYGSSAAGGWLPIINFSYPTGLMVFGNSARADYRFALVNSSLSNPLNLGIPGERPQWVAGGGISVGSRLRLGMSYSAGPYLNGSVRSKLPVGASWSYFTQRALGFDFQLTLPHIDLQGEASFSNFRVPNVSQRLGASGYFLELKHTLRPRLFAAARWNQLYFDRFRSGFDNGFRPRFDSNRYSLELGLGFLISESLLLKGSYQFNRTVLGVDPDDDIAGVQLVYRFDVRKLLRFP
jgi:hypothetical protein